MDLSDPYFTFTFPPWAILSPYILSKIILAIKLVKIEGRYPKWDYANKLPVPFKMHEKVRHFLFYVLCNPEWGIIKMAAFAFVWLFTGRKHLAYFVPFKVAPQPPLCSRCGDKGWFKESAFRRKKYGLWLSPRCKCNCNKIRSNPFHCFVCEGKRNLGLGRICKHC